jgi:hypothetical protein
MAIFDRDSRYVKYARLVAAKDRRGRDVVALTPAEVPEQGALGEHLKKDYQRLDHLANHYLRDPCGFWRIASANNALLPDALAEAQRVVIPIPRGD